MLIDISPQPVVALIAGIAILFIPMRRLDKPSLSYKELR